MHLSCYFLTKILNVHNPLHAFLVSFSLIFFFSRFSNFWVAHKAHGHMAYTSRGVSSELADPKIPLFTSTKTNNILVFSRTNSFFSKLWSLLQVHVSLVQKLSLMMVLTKIFACNSNCIEECIHPWRKDIATKISGQNNFS